MIRIQRADGIGDSCNRLLFECVWDVELLVARVTPLLVCMAKGDKHEKMVKNK